MVAARTAGLVFLVILMGCGDDPDACADQPAGTACTWLGLKGEAGFNGEGLRRWETQLNQVQDLLFLDDGSALYSDLNNHIVRRVSADGVVTTVVGWSDPIFPGDGPLAGIPSGTAPGTDWQLTHPTALVPKGDGTVLLAAWHNYKVLEIDTSGGVRLVAGGAMGFTGDGGPAIDARFERPNDVALDDAGNLYVVDQQNQRLRIVDPSSTIDTYAGTGDMASGGDGGPASDATFAWADTSSPNPSGNVLFHEGTLYVSDTEANRIRCIDLSTGVIDAFAGTGAAGYDGDGGPAADAQLSGPRDMEIGPDGDLYFADTDNGVVRAIDLEGGNIRTVVGTGQLGLGDEEQRPLLETPLRRPFGIAFDAAGDLYVMDSLNNRIVKARL